MHIPTFMATGALTPGTSAVRITAASGTNLGQYDNQDVLIFSIHFQAGSANDAAMTINYGGEEVAVLWKAPATGDLPQIDLFSATGGCNGFNLKNFTLLGDSNDTVRVWMTRA